MLGITTMKPSLAAIAATLMIVMLADVTVAQSGKGSPSKATPVPSNSGSKKPAIAPPTAPTASTPTGTPVAFAPEPFRLDAIGLVMRVPEGCSAQSTTIADRATTQITPRDSTWILNVQLPARTVDLNSTPAEMAEKTITLIQGSYGKLDQNNEKIMSTEATIIDRKDNLLLPGGAAARFYVSVPGAERTRIVKGYTIFKPTTKQFCVFELITSESEFAKARGLYETLLGTANFTDNEAVMSERGTFIKTGTRFFSGLSEADYVQVMHDKKLWQRLYKPASTGAAGDATELGYRGVRFWRGKRGEIDPDKARSAWGKAEQEDGYICSIEGRFLLDGGVADSRGFYFMRPDRSEETWSVKTVYTDAGGKQIAAATDTGARSGDSLTIVKKETGKPLTTLAPTNLGEGYISKFETFLLPRLVVKHKLQTTIGSYAWSDQERLLSFRKDEINRDPAQGGFFTIKTSFREEAATQTYTYSDKGDFVRGEIEGLGIWEPVEPEALMRLWKQKGLPTDR